MLLRVDGFPGQSPSLFRRTYVSFALTGFHGMIEDLGKLDEFQRGKIQRLKYL